MARTNTLGNFLTDVADAIRTKKGSQELIAAEDFDTEIENLPSGADLSDYFMSRISVPNANYSIAKLAIKQIPLIEVGGDLRQNLKYCSNLEKVSLKTYATSLPTSIDELFSGDKKLEEIDLTQFDSSNVTTATQAFQDVPDPTLTATDFSNFNTSKLQNMQEMFYNAYYGGTTPGGTLDLSSFTCPVLTNASYAFSRRKYIENILMPNFNPANLTTMVEMFSYCNKTKRIDLSSFTNANGTLTEARNAFISCSSLEELDLDSLDFSTLTNFSNMFNGVPSGCKVYVKDADAQNWVLTASNGHPSTWTTDNVIIAGSETDLRNA